MIFPNATPKGKITKYKNEAMKSLHEFFLEHYLVPNIGGTYKDYDQLVYRIGPVDLYTLRIAFTLHDTRVVEFFYKPFRKEWSMSPDTAKSFTEEKRKRFVSVLRERQDSVQKLIHSLYRKTPTQYYNRNLAYHVLAYPFLGELYVELQDGQVWKYDDFGV